MATHETHGLDTQSQVFFYEQDFYVLSNFSAFQLKWRGEVFMTAEHAYHWEKFPDHREYRDKIKDATSAHDAFTQAQRYRDYRYRYWDDIKVGIMRGIISAKAAQHPYVMKKLLDTGERTLIENSWRDDFWGWGPDQTGKNVLGQLWMELRKDIRDTLYPKPTTRNTS